MTQNPVTRNSKLTFHLLADILSKNADIVLNALIQNLLSEDMEWPPGAGIEAK